MVSATSSGDPGQQGQAGSAGKISGGIPDTNLHPHPTAHPPFFRASLDSESKGCSAQPPCFPIPALLPSFLPPFFFDSTGFFRGSLVGYEEHRPRFPPNCHRARSRFLLPLKPKELRIQVQKEPNGRLQAVSWAVNGQTGSGFSSLTDLISERGRMLRGSASKLIRSSVICVVRSHLRRALMTSPASASCFDLASPDYA